MNSRYSPGRRTRTRNWLAAMGLLGATLIAPSLNAQDNCSTAVDLATLTSPYSSTTAGATSDYSNACNANASSDLVFYIDVPAGYTLVIGQTANSYDSENYMSYGEPCPFGTTIIACYDDPDTQTNTWVNLTGSAQRVWWVQDGFSSFSNQAVPFTLAWSVTAPAACPAPSSSAATAITTTSANANWTTNGGSGTFIVEYGPAATFTTPGTDANPGANGTVILNATSPQAITGLTPSTQYRYFVRQDCGVDGFSLNSAAQTFTTLSPPPANDACANAVTVTCGGAFPGTTLNSTVDSEYQNCGAGGTNTTQRGVWYYFQGNDNEVTAEVCNANYDSRMTVYSGSCGAFTCVTANDDFCGTSGFRSQVTFNAFSGTDYLIYVHGFQSGASLSAVGTYTLNVTCTTLCVPVPGNDECAGAQPLTVDAPVTPSTNECSSASVIANPSCESSFATLPDVWFSFVASAGGTNIITVDLGTAANVGYAIYDACGGAQTHCIATISDGAPNEHTGFTAGNTYYIRLETQTAGDAGTFDIRVNFPCQPEATTSVDANCDLDQFSVDIDLTSLGTATTVDIVANVDGSGDVVVHDDVSTLMTYTAGPYTIGQSVNIRIEHDQSDQCDLDLGVLDADDAGCPVEIDCGVALNETHCYGDNDGTTWAWSSISGGPITITFNSGGMEGCCDDIIIRNGVDATGSILYQGNNGGNLTGLSVTSPSGSIFMEIDADGSVSCQAGSVCCTTAWDWDVTCVNCLAPQASANIAPDCANNEFSIEVDLTSLGNATSVDIVQNVDGAGDVVVFDDVTITGLYVLGPFTSGNDVVVSIIHDLDNECDLDLGSLTHNCPPPNDLCADAIAITCNTIISASTVNGTSTGAPTGNCDEVPPNDPYVDNGVPGVWYTVQGWDGQMTASLCASAFDTQIGIFTGSCGSFTCVAGNDDECGTRSIASWDATSAETYFIYVTGWSTTGAFTLEVSCGDTDLPCAANELTLELQTDGNGDQTSWEVIPSGLSTPVCEGSGFPNNATITNSCCLPDGCYMLRVLDSAGDGMTTGGYILRTIEGDRIIDNRNNFSTGFESAIANDQGFCLPIGEDRLIYTSCDKLDWEPNKFVVASMNPAVSAEWNDGAPNHMQDANSGYQFWFFDPNGSYSFRRFRSHATSDGYPATGPARAAHLRINNWGAINHIPEGVLLNVRVRSRVNGVNSEWGPACRFMLDPVAAQCPTTKLMDIPGNQFLSCGQYREFEPGSYVHARPVSGASSYEFRFRLPAEGYEVIRTGSSYFVQLYWTVPPPLATGSQYDVDVRAFKGGQWCPWGEVCTLNIGTDPGMQGGSQNAMMISDATTDATLNMWPNPNNGDQLFISLSEVPEGVLTVNVDMFDLFGKRVMARQIAANDGFVNTVLDLQGELAAGMYMVNIIAGEKVYTKRLVVQR